MENKKAAIVSFLKTRNYEGVFVADDFISTLPCLEHITETIFRPNPIVIGKDNLFWGDKNQNQRDELASFVDRIRVFNYTDAWYRQIMQRYEHGDAFGILKPVKREQTEFFDEEEFKNAYNHFSTQNPRHSSDWSTVRGSFAYKLIYCWKNGYRYFDAENWHWCERLMSKPLNFIEFKQVDACVFDNPKNLVAIYMSREYKDILMSMQMALSKYERETPTRLVFIAKEITEDYNNKKNEDALDKIKFVYQCYETAEGASDETKEESRKKIKNVLSGVSESIMTELMMQGSTSNDIFVKNFSREYFLDISNIIPLI